MIGGQAMLIGEKLTASGVLTEAQLKQILEEQKSTGGKLGDIAVKLGFASHEAIEKALK